MRMTLTLEDDVAAKLKAEARRSGRSINEIVNDALRLELAAQCASARRQTYKAGVRDLGELKSGLSLDNVEDLVDQVEGSLHR
jgi:predicted transcriptional regulator